MSSQCIQLKAHSPIGTTKVNKDPRSAKEDFWIFWKDVSNMKKRRTMSGLGLNPPARGLAGSGSEDASGK